MQRKNCAECAKPIIKVKDKAPRIKYCSPECAKSAIKKYQEAYRKIYATL
jgi:endogenous inhibitor of DNA gyrase (YacG/DUF329 family)